MNNKNIVVGGLLVLAIVFGVSYLKPTKVVVNNSTEPVKTDSYGSVTGPDRYFTRESSNGVATQFWSSQFKAATSTDITNITLASYRVVASTTLDKFTCSGVNVGYANTFEIGIGATQYATTTRLGIKTVAASSAFEVIASTTSNTVLTPGTYINFNVASGTPSNVFNATGRCLFAGGEV